jgi:hypothetical protein
MSRIVIVILIYHRHKPIDPVNVFLYFNGTIFATGFVGKMTVFNILVYPQYLSSNAIINQNIEVRFSGPLAS